MKTYRVIKENNQFVVITCDKHSPFSRAGAFDNEKDAISFVKRLSKKFADDNNIIYTVVV